MEQKIDETAAALLKAPQSARGWMLMGFLRLAALELQNAAESFDKAITTDRILFTPIQPNTYPSDSIKEVAGKLKYFALDNSKRRPIFGKDGPSLADPLRSIQSPLASASIAAIVFFTSKVGMENSLAPNSSPMRRNPTNNEIAINLLLENDLTIGPVVKSGTPPQTLDVTLEGNAKNLSLISSQTKSLTIRNAQKIAPQILLNFSKLTRLDMNGSDITDPPPLPRTTFNLSQLGLANTKIQSVKFAAGLKKLTQLDISNTAVTDLTPLAYCKSLRTLEAGGCRLENLRALKELPSLRNLTISPELLKNPQELGDLKSIPIPSIRTPEEPADQSAGEFFRKHLPVSQN